MREVLWLMLVAASACQGGGRSSDVAFDGEQALAWVRHQVAAGARVPNTEPHRVIGDWLERELRQRADSVEVQAFTHVSARGELLRLRNIIARFRPADPNRVLYLSHWDSRPFADRDPLPANRTRPVPGADDGASSTAVLLGVADQLKRTPPTVGVDLVFTDGEDYGDFDTDTDVLLGAKHFAANLPRGYQPLFAVLWDMVGDSDQVFLREQHSLEAAPEVVERVWRAARGLGLRRQFPDRNTGYINDDHVPLIRAGIRVINVIDIEYPYWHTTADTPDKLSAQSLANVGRLALALLRP